MLDLRCSYIIVGVTLSETTVQTWVDEESILGADIKSTLSKFCHNYAAVITGSVIHKRVNNPQVTYPGGNVNISKHCTSTIS